MRRAMIFALGEDRVLEVHEDLAAVQRSCEGIDVENSVWEFFDERGRPLDPVFVEPNERWRIFGKISMVRSGRFELTLAEHSARPSLVQSLARCVLLDPNPHFASLDEVKAHLARS